MKKLLVGAAVALTGAVAGVLPVEAAPKTILPIEFDCGSAGTFVYAGRQKGLQPRGELNGRTTKLSEIFVEVSSTFGSSFIIADWAEPRNPNLTAMSCYAYYVIGPTPGSEIPGDYLFANGWVVIYVK